MVYLETTVNTGESAVVVMAEARDLSQLGYVVCTAFQQMYDNKEVGHSVTVDQTPHGYVRMFRRSNLTHESDKP